MALIGADDGGGGDGGGGDDGNDRLQAKAYRL